MINHKGTRMAKMEKIDTDYKLRIWKIEAKLFNMRKPWQARLITPQIEILLQYCIGKFSSIYTIISDKFDISLNNISFHIFTMAGCFAVDIRYPWSIILEKWHIPVSICSLLSLSIFSLILLITVDLGKRNFQSGG